MRAAPDLVSLDDLMQRMWPCLVVGVETVSQRVMKLRAALADDSKEPRYIVGVRGRGYRLVALVTPLPLQSAEGVADQPAGTSLGHSIDRSHSGALLLGRQRGSRRMRVIAASVGVLKILGRGTLSMHVA